MKAVILAAGQGKRLGPRGANQPKGLVTIGEKPIIERSISQLVDQGIEEVGVVVGFQARKFFYLSSIFPQVSLLTNPLFANSGSMQSLKVAHEWAKSEILVLDSDIVYDTQGLVSLLALSTGNSVLVSGPTAAGDEVWAFGTKEQISGLSKNSGEFRERVIGEFVGICRLQPNFLTAMIEATNKLQPAQVGDYEEYISAIASSLKLSPCLVSNLRWGEIDTEEQLKMAAERIFPKLDKVF